MIRVLGLLSVFWSNLLGAEWFHHQQSVMGTRGYVELWHSDKARAQTLIQEAFDELERINQLLSPYLEQSELSRINAQAATAPVNVSPETVYLVQKSLYFSELSGGAFDITFASLGQEFDYRTGKKPTETTRKTAQANIGFERLNLDAQKQTLFFNRPGTRIDFGGIAKGYAVDQAIARLQRAGVKQAIVTAGGDSRIIGDRGGRPWLMGIKNPRGENQALTMPLADVAISTSGDYERYFIQDGVRYHHILNPKTGASPTEVISATVIAEQSVDADALATTLMVLGVEQGIGLINRMENVSAVIIDATGKVRYSKDLEPLTPTTTP